jgi:hypothetical protein
MEILHFFLQEVVTLMLMLAKPLLYCNLIAAKCIKLKRGNCFRKSFKSFVASRVIVLSDT